MSSNNDTVASLFGSRYYQGYAKSKLATDPLYAAVTAEIGTSSLPLLDVGCGIGLFVFYLRMRGYQGSILGIDYDAKKIAEAQRIAKQNFQRMTFRAVDARSELPNHSGNVTALDILQFFEHDDRARLLIALARRVAEDGKLVIRSGVADASWRFWVTRLGDLFASATRWMKSAPAGYPQSEEIHTILQGEGLSGMVQPLWGKTPFNNYLFVFKRPCAATKFLSSSKRSSDLTHQ